MWVEAGTFLNEVERRRVTETGMELIFGSPEPRILTLEEQLEAERANEAEKRARQRENKRKWDQEHRANRAKQFLDSRGA